MNSMIHNTLLGKSAISSHLRRRGVIMYFAIAYELWPRI